jgi:aspartyl/asparaginyl beta-hydroxylase (cupin superfamily)
MDGLDLMAGMKRSWFGKRVVRYGKKARFRLGRLLAAQSLVPDSPVLDLTLFPFLAPLEANWREIRAEFDRIYADPEKLPSFHEISPDQKRISKASHWKAFVFYGFGERSERNCGVCPKTAALLAGIPHLQSAWFSIIGPHYHVPAHSGVTKGILRAHLGLKVPADAERCSMRVDKERLVWREGRCFVFDDSYDHEVSNDTDETRAILLLDFDRPMRPLGRATHRAFIWALKQSPYFRDAKRNMIAWEDRFEASYQAWEAAAR